VVQLRGAPLGVLPPAPRDDPDHAALPRGGPAADGHAFGVQGGGRHRPALAHLAEPLGVRDPHVAEEDLVELGLAGDLAQRPDVHAGVGHVAQEVGHAAVLGHVGIGAGHQDGEPGEVGAGRPHLLAVDHPLVAVTLGAGAERGEVGAGPRLAEQLAPDLLTGPQRLQEPPLLLLGAERQDGRGRHAQADDVGVRVVVGCARRREQLVHLGLPRLRQAEPAVALGEVHPGQPGVVAGAEELEPLGGGGVVGGEELLHPLPQILEGHRASFRAVAWRRSSARASAFLWVSSGPSANRRVRIPA
jgi:hypothetical protein